MKATRLSARSNPSSSITPISSILTSQSFSASAPLGNDFQAVDGCELIVESLKVPVSNERDRHRARHFAQVRASGRSVHGHRFHGNELLRATTDDPGYRRWDCDWTGGCRSRGCFISAGLRSEEH